MVNKDPFVSYAARMLVASQEKLLRLRAQSALVYADTGPFAVLGVARHQKLIRNAELDVGLWEGRAGEPE